MKTKETVGQAEQRIITSSDGIQEATANGRLIAAAPDMLEALRALVGYPTDEHFRFALRPEHAAIIRAAIAKAEGRD